MAQSIKTTITTPSAPTATIGGSTAVDAALTSQDGPDALSLSAASVTAGATLAWTIYGPSGGDETEQIITAGSTSATPTWAAFTAASGKGAGLWLIKCVVTLDGLSTTYTRRVRVGDAAGFVSTYAPDLAALTSADWRSGGPGFSVDGETITVRNQATFSTGVLGPDGSTGIRLKPSSTGVNWSGADHSVGGVDFNILSATPGLTKNTPFDVIYAFRCDVDVSQEYQLFGAYVCNGPHTSDPRGAHVVRVYIVGQHIVEVQRRDGTSQVKVIMGDITTLRALAWRVEGMTARLFYSTSAVTSLPDSSFTGWTEVGPFAMDARDPLTAAQFTVADLTSGFICGLAGTPAATLDVTITGVWVRGKL